MQWTEDLSVGIDEIDSQHKELFNRINNLVAAIKQHRCKDEIDGTLRFLEEYAETHFAYEERSMQDLHYPAYAQHKAHHAQYLEHLSELKREAEAPRVKGSYYDLSVTANQMVVDWIIDHIMKVDKKFGEFLGARIRNV
jgi:hemerythrin